MKVLPDPRPYWAGLSDEALAVARDEYRTSTDEGLWLVADDIDDELARRENFRLRGAA